MPVTKDKPGTYVCEKHPEAQTTMYIPSACYCYCGKRMVFMEDLSAEDLKAIKEDQRRADREEARLKASLGEED